MSIWLITVGRRDSRLKRWYIEWLTFYLITQLLWDESWWNFLSLSHDKVLYFKHQTIITIIFFILITKFCVWNLASRTFSAGAIRLFERVLPLCFSSSVLVWQFFNIWIWHISTKSSLRMFVCARVEVSRQISAVLRFLAQQNLHATHFWTRSSVWVV